jgi:hypothetical protein
LFKRQRTHGKHELVNDRLDHDVGSADVDIDDHCGPPTRFLRHGLGIASFGDDVDRVLEILSDALGPPDFDGLDTSCPSGPSRAMSWRELTLTFVPDTAGVTRFEFYFVSSSRSAPPLGLATPERLHVGDSVKELRDLYGGRVTLRTVPDEADFPVWSFELTTEGGTVGGALSGSDDDDVVETIAAGTGCLSD